MAEPGLLGWEDEEGSRVRLGSAVLTTARHTLGLSILAFIVEVNGGTTGWFSQSASPVTNIGCHRAARMM